MKVAILAGGDGMRLAPETDVRPKALVAIGGRPILWHLIRYYRHYGHDEFVVALGRKGDQIVDYLVRDRLARRIDHVSEDGETRRWSFEDGGCRRATLVDTGTGMGSAQRLARLAPHLSSGTFMLTWCDGLADVDLDALLDFHRRRGRIATLTATRPPPRFGRLVLDGDDVSEFHEKSVGEDDWINGAFFVLEPTVFDYLGNGSTQFEEGPLQALAAAGQLAAFRHTAFWQCMDTVHERDRLEALWAGGQAPWKVWSD
jgi:glucose-1-phosphate cytidylyltransferase